MKKSNLSSKRPSFPVSAKVLYFTGVVFMLMACVLLAFSLKIQRDTDRLNRPVSSSFNPYGVGTPYNAGLTSIQIIKIEFTDGHGMFTAPADKKYAVVDLLIQNRSDKPIQVMPTSDTYVKDANGNVSYVTPFELTNPFRAGELLPGEQINGQLSYLISNSGNSNLYFDGIWSGGVVAFKLR